MNTLWSDWFSLSTEAFWGISASFVLMYIAVVLLTRAFGLRSFSKMSSGDFAMTIAVGSVLGAAVSNPSPTILMAAFALFGLFLGQWLFALVRRKSSALKNLLENEPLMLVWDGHIIEENLAKAQVTRSDIRAKLREANVFKLEDAAAVVFETTGDVSILHGSGVESIDEFVLEGVAGRPSA